MSWLLLCGLFVVSVLLLARLSERAVGALTLLAVVVCAVALVILGDASRAQAALVTSGTLAGVCLLTSSLVLPRARFSQLPRRRGRLQKGQASATPLMQGVRTTEVRLSDYEVLDRIGIGGMGNVYRARRVSDSRIVALKVPQEQYLTDAKFVKRFYREAEVLRRLAHPNIVRVLDYKAEGAEHYIAMEYLDGETLEHLLEARSPTFEESVQIIRALADALRHIHAQNIVHRDLKPANVMILRGAFKDGKLRAGGVKLMDFGIAVGKVLTRLTMTGARVGTPVYMAPEQAKGNKVDARSDVYSLGLLFYEMVAGETAFKGSYEAVVHQQVFEIPRPPKQLRLDVPGKLNDLILRMIEKDPAFRPSLDDVIASIDRGVLEEDEFTDAWALAVSVNERKGAVRLLDLTGRLRASLRDLTGEASLPAAPVVLTSDPNGLMYAAIVAYRAGTQVPAMIHKLDAQGRELMTFGRYGLAAGELLQPVGLAASRDRVYVLDGETCLVSMFTPTGEYLGRFGGRGTERGKFGKPVSLTLGSEGDVFVLDTENREVQRFSHDGSYRSRFAFKAERSGDALRPIDGLTVSHDGGVYIADAQASKIRRIEPDGRTGPTFAIELLQGEASETPWLLAVDEEGLLYCVRQGGQTLRKYSHSGKLLATVDTFTPVLAMTLLERRQVHEAVA